MYLGTNYISTKFRPDWTSNMAAGQPSWKTNKCYILENQQSAITPELMAGSSPNFYHMYI
jgi:hypothetical protein